eukprot:s427_g5.t1
MTGQAKHQRRRCLLLTLLGPLAIYFGSPGFALPRRAILAAAAAPWAPQAAEAISGGGKDFASTTLTQNLKGGKYDKKDFSGCVANFLDHLQSRIQGLGLREGRFSNSFTEEAELKP